MMLVMAVCLGLCAAVAWVYGDPAAIVRAFLVSGGAGTVLGCVTWLATRQREPLDLSRRDGFAVVTLGWLVSALLGAVPFLLSGVIRDPVAAVFETLSGFSTTGASVLANLEALPRGILFWRALTHFLGGMGVLVLCIAVLPFLGVGGMQIYRAEVPGPSKDRLTPRIASTAKVLWGVYLGICILEIVLLRLCGMGWFDSVCHSFATVATGGFSTRTESIMAYHSVYIDVVITVFMFISGANFALHYRALHGKVLNYFKDPEFRFYLIFWLASCLVLSVIVWQRNYPGLAHSLRAGFFQGTSIMTTTGFATEDFDRWPNAARYLLVLLMFAGACAGSTAGGIKMIRIFVVLKLIVREIRRFMQPQAVLKVKLGAVALDEEEVMNITAFFVIFILLAALATFVMTFFLPDLTTAFSAVAATMGNVGPGLGVVGPMYTYDGVPTAGKLVLIVCMLLGRLELYTVLVMLLPGFWKK